MTSMADIWHSKAILPWVTSSTLKIMRTKVLCTQNTTYLIKTFSNVILFFQNCDIYIYISIYIFTMSLLLFSNL